MTLICFCAVLIFNTWHFEYIPNATEDIMLSVDSAGIAHVVFYEGGIVYYAMRIAEGDSFAWSTEVIDTGAEQPPYWYGTSEELAIDENGNPHVTYFKQGFDEWSPSLCYACKDSSGAWNSTILDTSILKVGIACDSMNHPHIVYSRNTPVGWDGIWHTYWDGFTWITEYVTADAGYISLVLDEKDRLHISLGAPLLGERYRFFHYGFRDSTGWHLEYIGPYDARWPMGIVTDTNCNPHLSVESYPYDEFYVTKQGGEWIGEDITHFGFRFSTCITVLDNTPHLLGWDPSYYPYYTYHIWKPDSTWLCEDCYVSGEMGQIANFLTYTS